MRVFIHIQGKNKEVPEVQCPFIQWTTSNEKDKDEWDILIPDPMHILWWNMQWIQGPQES